jgi:hypothetical protein
MRGGGAIGGAILRSVPESSRDGGGGRRSGELLLCGMFFRGARAGIFDGLLAPDADTEAPNEEAPKEPTDMELASGFRETLAPKLDTGVLDRLGGGCPRTDPARLTVPDLGATDARGMPLFEGVFARGGAAFEAAAYSSSRYRLP